MVSTTQRSPADGTHRRATTPRRIATVETHELFIIGAGGSGREIAAWAGRASWDGRPFRLLGLVDDLNPDREVNGLRAWSMAEAAALHPEACVVAAVGDARLRERLITQALALGLHQAPPLVHPGVEID